MQITPWLGYVAALFWAVRVDRRPHELPHVASPSRRLRRLRRADRGNMLAVPRLSPEARKTLSPDQASMA
jgi:hypothetical protein